MVTILVRGSIGTSFVNSTICRTTAAASGMATDSRCSRLLRLVILRERTALEIGHQPARRSHRGHRHELVPDQSEWVQRCLVLLGHPAELHHLVIPHQSYRHSVLLSKLPAVPLVPIAAGLDVH